MKKYIKITVPLLGMALLAFLGFKVVSEIQYKKQVAKTIQTLPSFSYKTMNDEEFSEKNLAENKAVIFIYFNSTCHYCQNEAEEIKRHQQAFKNVQLIFVSKETPDAIKKFAEQYKLTGYDNIHFLVDEHSNFAKTFDASSIPYLLIYNKQQELVKKIKGQTKVAVLLEALQKNGQDETK